MIFINDEHSIKAEYAIDVTDDGISTSANDEHHLKTFSSI